MKTRHLLTVSALLLFLQIFLNNVIAAGFNDKYEFSNWNSSNAASGSGCLPQINSWVQRYTEADVYDEIVKVLADSCGNVYVTGYSTGEGTGNDFATIKYNSDGDPLWVKRFAGDGEDRATSMALDVSGNVYVTGYSFETGEGLNYVTIKYNSDGDEQWTEMFNSENANDDIPNSIGTDNSGNVYVTGKTSFPSEYITLKYDSNGDLIWERRYSGSLNDNNEASSLAIDLTGNIYVTGGSESESLNYDFLTIKYNTDGDTLWVKRYNGPDNLDESASTVKTDNSGNVYVNGYSYGNGTSLDYLTIKYDTDGNQQWVKRYNNEINGADNPGSLTIDNSGNVYVTGSSSSTLFSMDYLTIKYDQDGVEQWIKRYNGNSNYYDDIATGVEVDNSGNVFVTGYTTEYIMTTEFTTVKYNSSGVIQGVKHYNGTTNEDDRATTIASDYLGNIYIAGSSTGLTGNFNYALIKYAPEDFVFSNVSLQLKVYIQGYYNETADTLTRDTVKVYLRNSFSPYSIVDSLKGFLSMEGRVSLNFNTAPGGSYYYVSVKHRNSLETWSSFTILGTEYSSFDFTPFINSAYGNNLKQKGSSFCMFGGDVTQNGVIDILDLRRVDNGTYYFFTGYVAADLTGDRIVDARDLAIVDDNAYNFVTKITPP